jgi:hypothetical protein
MQCCLAYNVGSNSLPFFSGEVVPSGGVRVVKCVSVFVVALEVCTMCNGACNWKYCFVLGLCIQDVWFLVQ